MDFRTALIELNRVAPGQSVAVLIDLADFVVSATTITPEQQKMAWYDTHDKRVDAALYHLHVVASVLDGKKINAIKELRTITGCSLKEAKDAIEDFRVWGTYSPDSQFR